MPVRFGFRGMVTAVVLVVMAVFGLKACASPAHETCGSFLKQTTAQQLKAVHAWQKSNDDHMTGTLYDAQDLTGMRTYCAESGHSGDRLSHLQYSIR